MIMNDDDNKSQYTRANNINIINLYESDTLISMWVRIRSIDCDICNKGWSGQDIYGDGIIYPGFPPDLWPSQYIKCYWQFNKPGTVDDKSGNGNSGTHYQNPQILPF